MRFEIREEKMAGSRQKVYAIVDTNTQSVVARFSDEKEALSIRDKANDRADNPG